MKFLLLFALLAHTAAPRPCMGLRAHTFFNPKYTMSTSLFKSIHTSKNSTSVMDGGDDQPPPPLLGVLYDGIYQLFQMIHNQTRDDMRNFQRRIDPQFLNIVLMQPLPNHMVREYTSPLLYALDVNNADKSKKCWIYLLRDGANPTKFVYERTSPILKAIEYKNIEFINAVFNPKLLLADPLLEYPCGRTNMTLTPSYARNKHRVARQYTILKRVFESGWGAGAYVVLKAAETDIEKFDVNLTWSGDYIESMADYDIFEYQKSPPEEPMFHVGPHPPQSLLYRAAFHHMHRVVERLIHLGANPKQRNQDGHTLIHAVLFGACAATRNDTYSPVDGQMAAEFKNTLDILLQVGVDYQIPDNYQRFPRDIISTARIAPIIQNAMKASFWDHTTQVRVLDIVRRGITRLPPDIHDDLEERVMRRHHK
jgi:hypothetical protein